MEGALWQFNNMHNYYNGGNYVYNIIMCRELLGLGNIFGMPSNINYIIA